MKLKPIFFFAVAILLLFGFTTLFSVHRDLLGSHLFHFFLGLVIFFIVSKIDYRIFKDLSWVFYFLSLFLLVLPLFLGRTVRGSSRWLSFGSFTLQPSELAKPFLIIFFASLYSRENNLLGLFKSLFLVGLPAILILKQPDLGSSLVIIFIWVSILFFAEIKRAYLLTLAGFGALAIPAAYFFLKDYQKLRLTSFLNPQKDPLGSGYNAIQSMIAVGSGRFWGKGFLKGTQSQLQFLPERHTDFIFASFAEEVGFWGSSLLLAAYLIILYQILKIAQATPDKFGQLVALGIFAFLFFQIFVNLGMCLGLMPITGLTLPLVSYGGNSLLSIFASLGILANIAQKGRSYDTLNIS